MEGELEKATVIHLREVSSTNDEVLRLRGSVPLPFFVRADVQRAGRGRMGREWISDLGGLWMSGLLERRHPRDNYKMMLGGALAVARVVEREASIRPEVHFPNDVMVGGKKLAGILVEERDGLLIVGVGLNVNQAEPPLPTATTLRLITGRTYAMDVMADRLAAEILRMHSLPFGEVFALWKGNLATLGRYVVLSMANGRTLRGRLLDITEDMLLLMEGGVSVPAEHVLNVRRL
ncbi:MAG: biotin--[acetyl-CoA-carboxylase] ligase [Thermotogae bacterium]|nr:biotin--[acetyl-CoA-carboxylase] ligase [Thermotogota bacterium]